MRFSIFNSQFSKKELTLIKFLAGIFLILIIFFGIFEADWTEAAVYYIDYENGDDANDGLSPNTPKKHHPLDKDNGWSITDNTGHTIYMKKGVIYRGGLNVTKSGASSTDRLTTTYSDSFGTGGLPEFRGAHIYTGWEQDPTYTNCYKRYFSNASTILFRFNPNFGIWEDEAPLIGVNSLQKCNDIPGTFYLDSGTSYVYIHTYESDDPDNHTIEVSDTNYGVKQWSSQYITFQGIIFSKYRGEAIQTWAGAGDTQFNYCIFRDNDTGFLANGTTTFNNVTVIRNLYLGGKIGYSTADVTIKNSLIAANGVFHSSGNGIWVASGNLNYGNNNIVGNSTIPSLGVDGVSITGGTGVDLGGNISKTPKISSDFSDYSYLNFSIDDAGGGQYIYDLAQAFSSVTGGNVPLTYFYHGGTAGSNDILLAKSAYQQYGVEIGNHTESHSNLSLTPTIQYRYTGANATATIEVTSTAIIFRDSATTTESFDTRNFLHLTLPSGWEENINITKDVDMDILNPLAETDAKDTWVDMNVTVGDYYDEEVVEQSDFLEAEIGTRPVTLAYPGGYYRSDSDDLLATRGIQAARAVHSNRLDLHSTNKVELYYLGSLKMNIQQIGNSLAWAEAWAHWIATVLNFYPVFLTPYWHATTGSSDLDPAVADDFLQTIINNTNAKLCTMKDCVSDIKTKGTASTSGTSYSRKIPINILDLIPQSDSPNIDAGEDVGLSADIVGNAHYEMPSVSNTGSAGSYTKTYVDIGSYEYIIPPNPTLQSSTHPSETTWYSDISSLEISFSSPYDTLTKATTTDFRYLVNQTLSPTNSAVQAGTLLDDAIIFNPSSSITSTGTWYIHAIAQNENNTSTYSSSYDTYTINYDITAPSGFSLSLGSITTSSITATVSGATDSNAGLHSSPYYFDRDSGATTSGWQASNSWTDSGLSENTQYTYRVKVRDAASNPNESNFISESKYTLAPTPTNLTVTDYNLTSITLSVDSFPNDTLGSSGYYFSNTTKGTNSGWLQTNSWQETGLDCDTSYSYTVKYRNGDAVETNTISLTQSTDSCGGSGLPSIAFNPPSPPTPTFENPQAGFKVIINPSTAVSGQVIGAETTNNRNVVLKLFAGSDTKRMAISENPDFKNAIQEPYSETKTWTLSEGDGLKTIYVKFFTEYGVSSEVVSDEIVLQEEVGRIITHQRLETIKELQQKIVEIQDKILQLRNQLIELLQQKIREIQNKISQLKAQLL
jgi:peptidoglycan/xylan/chitin deacetylase (PgdA/CDA1 family)